MRRRPGSSRRGRPRTCRGLAAAELRITWEALANIIARVAAGASAGRDRLDGLRRIGIDEKSWGKGSGEYLVVVTDHDTSRVVWIAQGRDQATVRRFFSGLGGDRARIAVINRPLYKGYLIKEQIREAFKVKGGDGRKLMRDVAAWTHRCRIPGFTALARTLSRFTAPICATLDGGPSNAQVSALITRARGFGTATALMTMILFVHGGICPGSPCT